MDYRIIMNGQEETEAPNKAILDMISRYSRQLYGFTKSEFDSIVEYDLLNIISYFYSKMNAVQKKNNMQFR
ncbi:MAG: hypothetical protein K6G84_02290 [Lachnospiraceae bacterium]|nr:hypothetical protein [Lachnospiraceae bacterium]